MTKKKQPAMAYDSRTGQVMQMRWWHIFTDPQYRRARKEYRKRKDNPTDDLVVVATTDNGIDIAMPPHVAEDWYRMTEHERAEFMAAVNEQRNEEKAREA